MSSPNIWGAFPCSLIEKSSMSLPPAARCFSELSKLAARRRSSASLLPKGDSRRSSRERKGRTNLLAPYISTGLFAVLVLTACEKFKSPSPPAVSGLPAAPRNPDRPAVASVPTAPKPPPTPSIAAAKWGLVEQRKLAQLPAHFDPLGSRMGVTTDNKCEIWDLDVEAYAGEVDKARCEAWDKQQQPARAPNGQYLATVSGDTLTLKRLQEPVANSKPTVASDPGGLGTVQEAVTLRDKRLQCKDASEVRWSPDSTKVAVRCTKQGKLLVVDRNKAEVIAAPGLVNDDDVLSWAWGTAGIVVIGIANGEKDDSGTVLGPVTATAYYWPAPDKPPKKQELGTTCGGGELRTVSCAMESGRVVLDPRGRMAFLLSVMERESESLSVFDFRTEKPSKRFSYSAQHNNDIDSSIEILPGRWIFGKYPIWETLEKTTGFHEEDSPTWTAYRLYTAPGVYGLESVPLKKRPSERRIVKDDGKTIVPAKGKPSVPDGGITAAACAQENCDPTGRFIGVAKNALRRISDGAELRLLADGCAVTKEGVFDCKPEYAEELVFRSGDDVITSPLLRDARFAKLLHHPHLIEDFFNGASVAPPESFFQALAAP